MSLLPTTPEIVLIASPDGPITAYDPYTGAVLARFSGSQCPRNGITVISNNQFACSHVSDTGVGYIHLYNWWSRSCVQSIHLPEPVAPLVATNDGSYIFSGGVSGHIQSVLVPSGDLIRSVSAHEKPVSCIVISCDESLVISGSDDGTIAIIPILLLLDVSLDPESGCSSFTRFTGHELSVTGLTTGMGVMISSSLDWTCKVWNIVKGTHLQTVKFQGEMMCSVLDPSETQLYAGGMDGTIYRKDLKVETRKQVASGGEVVVWGRKHDAAVVAMDMLNYGQSLLTVSENGQIHVWEAEGATEVAEMEEAFKAAVEDRGRVTSNLESAIEIHKKLMELMLKEANAIAEFEESIRKQMNI
ncbi:hypothetical protein CTI12_AA162920 [Artemisia annua]|uniref:Uncharacterized protein n=1 Tax=Artemisia annua TaxID=35608 RepID=A0A2U1PEC4_ARTAN|nr:hypothetical protein CTI12_AA162920 [Artemisia annua]